MARKRKRAANAAAATPPVQRAKRKAARVAKKLADCFGVRWSGRVAASDLAVRLPSTQPLNRSFDRSLQLEQKRQLEAQIRLAANERDLEVAECGAKGRGLRTLRPFARGEFVLEYKGDLLDQSEAVARERRYEDDPSVGSFMFFFKHKDRRWCVDATAESPHKCRLLNHSVARPNLRPRLVEVDHSVRICFFAIRDIGEGEELLFDYGDRSPTNIADNPWLRDS
ncbi:[Histone H4]-lysine(20) N-methyltransferase [Aphelenchoides fujianensis]|nr:[Histone H4]-lysine(20) N-methyltransferase [Aphelenchoides fujianensis]